LGSGIDQVRLFYPTVKYKLNQIVNFQTGAFRPVFE